jgi:hypothetical protein
MATGTTARENAMRMLRGAFNRLKGHWLSGQFTDGNTPEDGQNWCAMGALQASGATLMTEDQKQVQLWDEAEDLPVPGYDLALKSLAEAAKAEAAERLRNGSTKIAEEGYQYVIKSSLENSVMGLNDMLSRKQGEETIRKIFRNAFNKLKGQEKLVKAKVEEKEKLIPMPNLIKKKESVLK